MSDPVRERLAAAGLDDREAGSKSRLFSMASRALDRMREEADSETALWYVPGRVEVLGKHTDYAGGPSLLAAAERGFCLAASPRTDSEVRIVDVGMGLECRFSLPGEGGPPAADWEVYPRTVARRIARNFPGPLRGADVAFASDLPPSAGMSSSSALVVALFSVLADANRLDGHPAYRGAIRGLEDLAGYLGSVENGAPFGTLTGDRGVGTFGGSEDHTAILCCSHGLLALYRYNPVRHQRSLPMPAGCRFVIGVSGVEARKAGAAREQYNRASLSAAAILEAWHASGGGSEPTLLDAVTSSPDAPERIRETLRRVPPGRFTSRMLLERFEQFLEETRRVIPAAMEALERGDLAALGEAVDRSQQAAERFLGNQLPETIDLARSARALGARAASAFGGGYGGSVWALVDSGDAGAFCSAWESVYHRRFPEARGDEFFITGAGPGRLRL
jgi:galactokinase